jgi:glycosyltransferase involved in cell wall biosynthesis
MAAEPQELVTQPSSSAPRVLHLLAPAHFGGLESVVLALASMRHRLGRPTAVATVVERWNQDLPLAKSLESEGVPVFPVVVPARAYLRERALLRRILKEFAPAVLHTHGHHSDVMGATLGAFGGPRLVSTVHGFVASSIRGALYHWIQRTSYHAFDAVIVVSDLQRRQLLRTLIPERRLRLIPNTAPAAHLPPRETARALLGLPSRDFVVGWVGRLSREKGADILLHAIAAVPDASVTVSIIGEGRERASLEKLARELHLESRVRWHGFQPDAGRLFNAFDLFVLSSRTEGVPLVLLEARMAGLPIVATRVGGVPDIVSGDTAALVPPDNPEALARAIVAVRSDPASAQRKAAAGAAEARKGTTTATWLDRYEQVYREVTAES